MERLLEEACEEILQKVKSKVCVALSAEGLNINPSTLEVSQPSTLPKMERVTSVRVFTVAESVRSLLEIEVCKLVRDATPPDAVDNSSQALLRALHIHCAALLGHVVIFLRHIALSCQTVLKSHNNSPASVSPILSGALIVGRIAWLLKINGKFVEQAFVASMRDLGQSPREIVSESQLLSAFEIADTNGDSVVTLPEAIEVPDYRCFNAFIITCVGIAGAFAGEY